MSFAKLQKLVTYLFAALGLYTLSFGTEVAAPILLAFFVLLAVSWLVEGPLLERRGWQRGTTAIVLLVLAVQLTRGFSEGGWLGLAMEFSAVLTLSRLFNRRSAADYQQVAMMSFVQLIAATVLTTDLAYAAVFVAFAIVTPWVLTFAHLRREIERNYPVEADLANGNDLARVLASKRIVDWSFLLSTALLSVPMLLMTVTLFALFPRIGLGMLNVAASRGQHVSGFGDNVELGGFGLIRDDPTVVVRVTPNRPISKAVARRVLRLRGTAFDHYDGRKWTRSSSESVKMGGIGEYYPLKRMARDDDLDLRIILDRLDQPVLFVPTGAVGLRIPERGLPGMRQRITLTRGHGFDIRYVSREELGIVYHGVVSLARGQSDVPVDRELDDSRYLALPPGHERLIALAQTLTRDLPTPLEKAKRLEQFLRKDGGFAYSLELPDVRGKVPLDAFVFEVKRGHCEYFSSALAIMLRAIGIPSRNVSGYLGGEFNEYGGYYAVRQADAHSWVEALLPERGWVLYEPTPPSRDSFQTSELFRELRAMADAARAYWMTNVVSYDLRTQLRGLRRLRELFKGLSFGDWSRERDRESEQASRLPARGTALIVLAVVVVGAALVLLQRRRARRVGRRLPRSAREAQRLYRELERLLARRGLARPPHVTPEAHARALVSQQVAASEAISELTEAYAHTRYGGAELAEDRLRELRARLREVKRAA